MAEFQVTEWARGLASVRRDRHSRRAEDLAARLDALVSAAAATGGSGSGSGRGSGPGDDDEAGGPEIVLRPWECRLPRLVVLAAAESRGLVPVGGREALVERGPWLEPMRFTLPGAHPATSGAGDGRGAAS